MIDYKIVIPSYKRSKTIKEKTLSCLEKYKINKNKIIIFVANSIELEEYKKILGNDYLIIIGKETLKEQRKFIRDYFLSDENIVSFDDDIKGIYFLNEKKLKEIDDLDKIVDFGFSLCFEYKTKLWGVYPASNEYFMRNNYSIDLKYIIGSFYGFINEKDDSLNVTIEDKEDFERSILYFRKYGKVIRLNNITVESSYYNEKGGMQETRTEERIEKDAKILLKKYPEYCQRNLNRTKHYEIRLFHNYIDKIENNFF